MQKIELEPDEKPNERKPSLSCPRRDCSENLFGYCQTTPNLGYGDINMFECKTFRLRRQK
jgi:hypothetical protein